MIDHNLLLTLDAPTVEVLTDPQPRDPERVRKFSYLVEQMERPERAADRPFLASVKREILREHR